MLSYRALFQGLRKVLNAARLEDFLPVLDDSIVFPNDLERFRFSSFQFRTFPSTLIMVTMVMATVSYPEIENDKKNISQVEQGVALKAP